MMPNQPNTNSTARLLLIISGILLLAGFFLPWVSWEGSKLAGFDMATGNFFRTSEKKFSLGNPFPQFNFAFALFWMVPILSLFVIVLTIKGRVLPFISILAGMLALGLVTAYILFTNILLDLGVGRSLWGSLCFGIFITIPAAICMMLASLPAKKRWEGLAFVIAGPLLAWLSFMLVSNYIEKEKFKDPLHGKSDYSVNAMQFINEFRLSDSTANKKYNEKIITVTGRVGEIEAADTTMNIKFIDTTTGSYAIFAFQQDHLGEARSLTVGDSVSLKGSCSGGVYSDILETEFISFKRCALVKKF
ncbi:MAG TPA: hypothetical protein VLJ68_12230 [Chitinophagaceae bacterium]|nr:hypothetical protein [Chitinophagaceae bacterium]